MAIDPDVTAVVAGCLSGALGDTVFSHNQYGPYTRARTTPTYPATSAQQTCAQAMSFANTRWGSLSPPAKRLWEVYAAKTPLRDRCGTLRTHTARTLAMRSFIYHYRYHGFLSPTPGPPIYAGFPGFAPVRIVYDPPITYEVHFDDTEAWCGQTKAYMIASMTGGAAGHYGPNHHFYAGPHTTAILIEGNTSTPVTSPQLMFDGRIEADEHRYARIRHMSVDGRLSPPQTFPIFP